MNDFFVTLFGKQLPICAESFVVYYAFRSDIMRNGTPTARMLKSEGVLISGLSVQSAALICNLTTFKVKRCVEELEEAGWVKSSAAGFELGRCSDIETKWFCEGVVSLEEEDCETLTAIRSLARPTSRHLSISKSKKKLASSSLGGLVREDKASRKVLSHFISKHSKFSDEELILDHKTKYVFAGRILKFSHEDLEEAYNLISWGFKNWDQLKLVFRQVSDTPSLNFFATKSVYESLTKFQQTGIPSKESLDKIDKTGMATRANKNKLDQAKDEGW